MNHPDCPFCTYKTDKTAVVFYENKNSIVRLDLFPAIPRHLLVIPKEHIADLTDLTNEIWLDILDSIKHAKEIAHTEDFVALYNRALKNPLSEKSTMFVTKALASPFINKLPDAFNIGNNEGEAAGRTVHHCHIHILPRYWGDVKNPTGGIRDIFGDGSY